MVFLWFSYGFPMKSPWNHHVFFCQDLSPSSLSSHGDLRKIEREDRGKFQKRSPNAWKPWFNMGHTPKSGICMYILYILFIYIYIYLLYNIEWYDVNEPFLFGKKSYWLGSPWCLLQVDWTNFRPGKASTDTRHFCRLFVSGNCRPNKILQVY